MKPIKWTKEKVIELSSLYKGPSEFKKANASAYKAARRYGLINSLYPMDFRERHSVFTESRLLELMQSCSTRSDFQSKHGSAYNAARKLGLISVGFPTSNQYNLFGRLPYSQEELITLCKKYSSIEEFAKANNGAYQVACRKGLLQKYGPKPVQGTSAAEQEVLKFLQSLVPDFITKRFSNDYELDCYSAKLKLGVEYNGLCWHSEATGKYRKYHLNKTEFFKKLGIRIIHIWEHEWRDRPNQVKNYLQSACKVNYTRVGARKCTFTTLPAKDAKAFLKEHHIQGAPNQIKLAIGAYLDGILLSVGTFGKHHRDGHSEAVLNRFACLPGTTVVGGLAKMTKMAYKALGPLKSWAHYCKSDGAGYLAAGWTLKETLQPDYFYVGKKGQIISKQSRQKNKIGTPKGMTEAQHAIKDGLSRVWDCGKLVLIYPGKTLLTV